MQHRGGLGVQSSGLAFAERTMNPSDFVRVVQYGSAGGVGSRRLEAGLKRLSSPVGTLPSSSKHEQSVTLQGYGVHDSR